ncbi:histidinol-phosphatase HisJ family protein [Faecalicatena contorta]|uniref:histidinol-phosphatase HisJ family protein n=1 Tax=Faecalicatena contorta TaxID=39482 RepID=UPI001F3DFF14|nr:histidinol-phosphatase HisJ family protein [Faecalicatena contorta]
MKADRIIADIHMHSTFSHDSESAPEEMIRGAVEKGLRTICFTDHYDKDEMEWGEESIFDPEEYFRILPPLAEKYKDKIDVKIGVELGLRPYLGDYYRAFVKKYPFDFVIGSVHMIQSTDPAAGKLFRDYTDEEAYRIGFEEMLEDIKNFDDFDSFGHMDYMVRYAREQEKSYSYRGFADEIDAVLRALVEKGKALELNTAGLKYGLPFAHPHPDILKRYRELGGEMITVGADGHKPEHIAYDFHKVSQILQACGFRFYTVFSDRKPIFIELP